jgi:hemolysin III
MGPRETFNVVSHAIGAVLAAAGGVWLIARPLQQGDLGRAAAFAVFSLSLVLVYVTSILFHCTRGDTRDRFRRLDRIAIYVLIVGCYTPICLLVLPRSWGWPLFALAIGLSLAGVLAELLSEPSRKLHGVSLYLVCGWAAIAAIQPLAAGLTPTGAAWLVAGGVLYTLGAAAVRLRFVPLGHEIWHVAVLAASACHFFAMFRFVR